MDQTNYGGYLQLHSGTRWDIENPTAAMVHIVDIANSLSKQCRFAGHIKHFYSVAEHSVYVAEEIAKHHPVNFELQLLGLLHDATESILVDIPRPIKKYLKGYYELELKTWKPIAECFRLSHYEDPLREPAVMSADNAVLLAEKAQIVPSQEPWAWAKDIPVADVSIQCVYPEKAKTMFLAKFVTLNYMRNQSQC